MRLRENGQRSRYNHLDCELNNRRTVAWFLRRNNAELIQGKKCIYVKPRIPKSDQHIPQKPEKKPLYLTDGQMRSIWISGSEIVRTRGRR
jgi:hypothetical protein